MQLSVQRVTDVDVAAGLSFPFAPDPANLCAQAIQLFPGRGDRMRAAGQDKLYVVYDHQAPVGGAIVAHDGCIQWWFGSTPAAPVAKVLLPRIVADRGGCYGTVTEPTLRAQIVASDSRVTEEPGGLLRWVEGAT